MPLHVWYDSRLEGQSFLLNASAYGGREKLKSAPCSDFFSQKPWHPPPQKKKTIAQLAQPYKWSVSVRVISTIPTVADAMHLKSENHPRKIRDDESLQRSHSWQGGWRGRGKEGCCCCLPLLLLFSLRGLRWVSRLRLFPLSFPVFASDSLLLALLLVLSLSQPFFFLSPHPLFIPPHPALGLSQGLNLWLWSYRGIGMATHALLCFVSMLAWRLAPWLGCVFMHCAHVMMYVRLVQAKKVHRRPFFPVSLHFFFFSLRL